MAETASPTRELILFVLAASVWAVSRFGLGANPTAVRSHVPSLKPPRWRAVPPHPLPRSRAALTVALTDSPVLRPRYSGPAAHDSSTLTHTTRAGQRRSRNTVTNPQDTVAHLARVVLAQSAPPHGPQVTSVGYNASSSAPDTVERRCSQMHSARLSVPGAAAPRETSTFRILSPSSRTPLVKLNILELFLDCITESNERLVEFGVGGICNSCVDPANVSVITQCGGIPLVVQCLSSPVRNTVIYALGALYYLCNPSTKKEILKPDVLRMIRDYSAAGAVNSSFSSLANAFLDKHANS